MKKLSFLLLAISSLTTYSQTNVSGGIYTNTTWTKVNSPYIVTDTVVVFPGATLTIEAGVTVRFDNNTRIEVREARIIANGTAADSITFTSNTSSTPGSWGGIYINHRSGTGWRQAFDYCNFIYADRAVYTEVNCPDTLFVSNSNFQNNNSGIFAYGMSAHMDLCSFTNNTSYGAFVSGKGRISNSKAWYNSMTGLFMSNGTIKNCDVRHNVTGIGAYLTLVDSCIVSNNQTGIRSETSLTTNTFIDSNSIAGVNFVQSGWSRLKDCQVIHNGIGVKIEQSGLDQIMRNVIENNQIGIQLDWVCNDIYCNRICSNSLYNIKFSSSNTTNSAIRENFWCSSDSATIASTIYDGYDDINLGLLQFTPFDTTHCYAVPPACSASFILLPDTTTPHTYWILQTSTGVDPFMYYEWSWGDGGMDTGVYVSHVYANPGYYDICLKITDYTGCTDTFCSNFYLQRNTNSMIYVNVVPSIPTGIPQSPIATPQFTIYPNPASTYTTISINESLLNSTATITDITGRRLMAVQLTTHHQSLITSNLSSGVYFVTITNNNGKSATKKLVVSR